MPKSPTLERALDKIEPRELLPMARVVLTPKRFEAWYAVDIDGYTVEETGDVLRIARSSVYERLNNAYDDLEMALALERVEAAQGAGFALLVYEQGGDVINYEDKIVKSVVKRYEQWQQRKTERKENRLEK